MALTDPEKARLGRIAETARLERQPVSLPYGAVAQAPLDQGLYFLPD